MSSVRRRFGSVRIDLDATEAVLLASLVAQIGELLAAGAPEQPTDPIAAAIELPAERPPAPEDPVLRRLLPDAYRDDPEAAGEYRRLTEGDLRAQKRAALRAVLDAIAVGERQGRGRRLDLTDESAEQWLYALTDVRLVLGTRLGVTEEMSERDEVDATSPLYAQFAVYDWVTALQDALVRAVAGD
jgi:hypothetical protein